MQVSREKEFIEHYIDQLALRISQQSNRQQTFEDQTISAKQFQELVNRSINQNRLNNPFETTFNKNAKEADRKALEWVDRFQLITNKEDRQAFLASNFIELVSGAYSDCDLELLVHNACWILFLYINDDTVEHLNSQEIKSLNERKIRVLKDEVQLEKGDKPLTCAMHEVMELTRNVAKPWIDLFLYRMNQHFEATIWEAENREKGITIPDFKTYMEMRLHTGAPLPALLLSRLGQLETQEEFKKLFLEINISDDIFEKYVQKLDLLCCWIICISNDVKSSPKEFKKRFMNNLVFIIKKEFHYSIEEAVKKTIEIHNDLIKDFEKEKEELFCLFESKDCDPALKEAEADIRKYIKKQCDWMGSHCKFAETSPRYNED